MPDLSTTELELQWQERVKNGTYSPGILGVGHIRIMGRSGDTAIQFPRITRLSALGTLEPDEQYAVRVAQRTVEQAGEQQRTIFAINPAQAPERVTEFRPDAESLIVVARVAGG